MLRNIHSVVGPLLFFGYELVDKSKLQLYSSCTEIDISLVVALLLCLKRIKLHDEGKNQKYMLNVPSERHFS